MALSSVPTHRPRNTPDLIPAILLGGPAFVLLLIFLIGPFFAGVSYSFTNQRLISGNPTEFVGIRNYTRLLRLDYLMLEPTKDQKTGQPARDETGNVQYQRSRDFTRDEVKYPQYKIGRAHV